MGAPAKEAVGLYSNPRRKRRATVCLPEPRLRRVSAMPVTIPGARGRNTPSPPDTPQRRVELLVEPTLVPVAEALTPRIVVVVLRRRLVPPGGTRTAYVKSADDHTVVEQHI